MVSAGQLAAYFNVPIFSASAVAKLDKNIYDTLVRISPTMVPF